LLIDRIYLRNYRVFEDELELLLPPGLVGVYGPNGAGKSSLLESILWTLWGKARTGKEEVASSGTHGECVAEMTFEHEGHVYLVRRTITGVNATVRAEAHCDGLAMAEGVRDTGRYVHSVLGMDDGAFRASVFAEQKQLDAFSSQSPADRRKLVLALLGVTPLDAARDKARAEAREVSAQHGRLRGMLPDADEARVAAADAEARASALEVAAVEEEGAAAAAEHATRAARESFDRLDRARQEHEVLVVEGKAARSEMDAANRQVEELSVELAQLAGTEEKLGPLEAESARLPVLERRVALVQAVSEAAHELAGVPSAPAPPPPDEDGLASAERAAMAARSELGAAQAGRGLAAAELQRAEEALAKSSSLSKDEDCPLCGQPLGDAFAQVQAHRAVEVEEARERMTAAEEALAQAATAAEAALATLQRRAREVAGARDALVEWQQVSQRRSAAADRLAAAVSALGETGGALSIAAGAVPAPGAITLREVTPDEIAAVLGPAQVSLQACRQAAEEVSRLRGRLERRPQAELSLGQAKERAEAAASLLEVLRAKVKSLGFDPAALAGAQKALREAEVVAQQADLAARASRLSAATAAAEAQAEAKRWAEAQAQHARLGELESSAVHLSRTAELLNAFRNSVVASVGPRLAVQAAELFAELTDNEYDRLEVDPETYGLRICDGGISYDLGRFSGSEVDLANLALRVAISEHVRFQAGGTVGLLVLDEVFGPLDEERRARMLLALERLRGRFRQILVVTHSMEIKEQLPNAIEVVKKRGRRATARVLGA
jgi:exonuclease SbcC